MYSASVVKDLKYVAIDWKNSVTVSKYVTMVLQYCVMYLISIVKELESVTIDRKKNVEVSKYATTVLK